MAEFANTQSKKGVICQCGETAPEGLLRHWSQKHHGVNPDTLARNVAVVMELAEWKLLLAAAQDKLVRLDSISQKGKTLSPGKAQDAERLRQVIQNVRRKLA